MTIKPKRHFTKQEVEQIHQLYRTTRSKKEVARRLHCNLDDLKPILVIYSASKNYKCVLCGASVQHANQRCLACNRHRGKFNSQPSQLAVAVIRCENAPPGESHYYILDNRNRGRCIHCGGEKSIIPDYDKYYV